MDSSHTHTPAPAVDRGGNRGSAASRRVLQASVRGVERPNQPSHLSCWRGAVRPLPPHAILPSVSPAQNVTVETAANPTERVKLAPCIILSLSVMCPLFTMLLVFPLMKNNVMMFGKDGKAFFLSVWWRPAKAFVVPKTVLLI